MCSKEYIAFIDKYPAAVDAESSLKILKHLHNKSIYKLPNWCSTNTTSRKEQYQRKFHMNNE